MNVTSNKHHRNIRSISVVIDFINERGGGGGGGSVGTSKLLLLEAIFLLSFFPINHSLTKHSLTHSLTRSIDLPTSF